jgi:hypothetical protein
LLRWKLNIALTEAPSWKLRNVLRTAATKASVVILAVLQTVFLLHNLMRCGISSTDFSEGEKSAESKIWIDVLTVM